MMKRAPSTEPRTPVGVVIQALIAAAVVASASCGGPAVTPEPPPPPPPVDADLPGLAPYDPDTVIWGSVERLRSASIWRVVDRLADEKELAELRVELGLDPLTEVDEVVLAASSEGRRGPAQFLFLVKGSFDAVPVIESAATRHEAEPQEIQGTRVASFGGMVGVAITDRTVALGTRPWVGRAIALASGEGRSLRDNPEFSDLELDDETAALFRYRRSSVAPDLSRLRRSVLDLDLEAITALDAVVRADSSLGLTAKATTETQLDAATIARRAEAERRRLAQNVFVVLLGVDWILERIAITSRETSIELALELSQQDIEELQRLADRIEKLRRITEGELQRGGLDDKIAPPPPKKQRLGDQPLRQMRKNKSKDK